MTRLRNFLIACISLVLALGLQASLVQAAPNAFAEFATDKDTYTVGDTVDVNIFVTINDFNAGSHGGTIQYDTSKLQYVSTDNSGSPFDNVLRVAHSPDNGTINYGQYTTNSKGVAGKAKVRHIVFKAKSAGIASFNFLPATMVIYKIGSEEQEPLSLNTKLITISAAATPTPPPPPASTPQPPASTPVPPPPATIKTPVPTPKKTATPAPKKTSVATPAPAATPAPTSNGGVSAEKSEVTFSNTTGIANGVDTIGVTVTLKRDDGSIITDKTIIPEFSGLRPDNDVASPFAYDEVTQSWNSQIISTVPGITDATITAQEVKLNTTSLTWVEPEPSPAATNQPNGGAGAFGRMIFIIVIFLLLLLALLYFLWRRLRKDDDEDGGDGGFPGSEETPLVAAAEEKEEPKDDVADFNPTHTLSRASQEPELPAEAAADDTNKPGGTVAL